MSAFDLQVIAFQDLQLGELRGTGSHGEVYQGKWNGRGVAIKKFFLKKLTDPLARDFERETKILAEYGQKCPQIVKLIGICTEIGRCSLVMEEMEKSLNTVLNDPNEYLPWIPHRFQIVRHIAKGLFFLHTKGMVHGNLKSPNVLLDGAYNAKISDFVLSKIRLESRLNRSSSVKKGISSVCWKAPELLQLNPVATKASDIYAFAIVLWEIVSCKPPYGDAEDSAILELVKEGHRESIPENCPEALGELIQKAWTKEPEKRPDIQSLLLRLENLIPKPPAALAAPELKKEVILIKLPVPVILKPEAVAVPIIPWTSLNVGEVLGQGSFGKVFKGRWNGQDVAIKAVEFDSSQDQEYDQETALMAQCQDRRIVQLLGICKEPNHYSLVLEYMERGSLYSLLKNRATDLPWNPLRWQMAKDIVKGVAYLHEKNIVHRDLKSPNVLLDGQFHAKICDFGLSKIKLKSTIKTVSPLVGTLRWIAPEVIEGSGHSKESDVYTLGLVLWELASRDIPFSGSHVEALIKSWILDGKQEEILKFSADCLEGYKKLILRCWTRQPEERPVAAQAVKSLKRAMENSEKKS